MKEGDVMDRIAASAKVIFSWCRARVTTLEDAEDLSQDILEALVRSAGSLRSEEAFYGFMWAVAGNVFRRWLRKKRRRDQVENPAEAAEELSDGEDFTEALVSAGEDERNLLLLRRELGLLETKYRRAALLYYHENRSVADIAGILKLSESMVKYLLFKSRSKLKEGMVMERKTGVLSYNPVTLIPLYSGDGTNHFQPFMQSRIRQNILWACTNDALTAGEISLEIGVPLPYMEDDLAAMEEKRILIRQGKRYRSGVVIRTAAYEKECEKAAEPYHARIAEEIARFLDSHAVRLGTLGENTADFSESTLRWQLAAMVFRQIRSRPETTGAMDLPTTAWGDHALLSCAEERPEEETLKHDIFRYCSVGTDKDTMLFWDYVPKLCGDHHDFFGKDHLIALYCDLAREERNPSGFGAYDRSVLEELEKKGYVRRGRKNGAETLRVSAAVFTDAQYQRARDMAASFVDETLSEILDEMRENAVRILREHTPKHLADQVPGVASMDVFLNGVCIPAEHMIADGVLTPERIPGELPGVTVVLGTA